MRRGIGRHRWWALLSALLLLGVWGIHVHLENAGKCLFCIQSLAESGLPAGLDVPRVSRPLPPHDVQVSAPCDLTFLFASRAPPLDDFSHPSV